MGIRCVKPATSSIRKRPFLLSQYTVFKKDWGKAVYNRSHTECMSKGIVLFTTSESLSPILNCILPLTEQCGSFISEQVGWQHINNNMSKATSVDKNSQFIKISS